VRKNLAHGILMKQFVNITSGTLVDSAIWKGYDIEEVEVSESNQILIDSVLKKKKRTKDFITRLSLKINYDNLQYKKFLLYHLFF
jgi:hypothetical protein